MNHVPGFVNYPPSSTDWDMMGNNDIALTAGHEPLDAS
jgi:hypothetical protein